MGYTKQNWVDGPDGGTPISAARLNHIESGIESALFEDDVVNSLEVSFSKVQLVGDVAEPGNNRYYGTDSSGVKGFHELVVTGGGGGDVPSPHSLGGTHHSADTLANLNAKISDATLDDQTAARPPTSHGNESHSLTFLADGDTKNSVEVNVGDIQLVGDVAAPGNNQVYGTDDTGTRGWKPDVAVSLTAADVGAVPEVFGFQYREYDSDAATPSWPVRGSVPVGTIVMWIKRDAAVPDPPIDATYALAGVDIALLAQTV